jgi:hypothetical protein
MLLLALLLASASPVVTPGPALLSVERVGHAYGVSVFADGHLERFIDSQPVLGPAPHVDPALIQKLQALFKDLDHPPGNARHVMCDSAGPNAPAVKIEYRGRQIPGLSCPNSALTRALAQDAAEVLDSAFDLSAD